MFVVQHDSYHTTVTVIQYGGYYLNVLLTLATMMMKWADQELDIVIVILALFPTIMPL